MRAHLLAGLTMLMVSLAGCTGNFDIKQTEPLRVQIDGEAQESRVDANGSNGEAESEFKIERTTEVETVTVVVEVVKVTMDDDTSAPTPTDNETEPAANQTCVVLVTVEDRDTGETIEERRVEADNQGTSIELNIDIKGKDNVVIVTQAVQGVADVSVAATTAEANETAPPAGNTTSPAPTTSPYP